MFGNSTYNPDVLTCLANLSNDEVFTPPSIVNQMLDMLPQELFRSKETKFLDPVSKSGVFLREIAKRLMDGIAEEIPDKQERANHIFTHQLYGMAITNLTALISRRSVYCSKHANGRYSLCTEFLNAEGNIRYKEIEHSFVNHKCKYCGVSEDVFGRQVCGDLESHAYEFIHTDNPKKLFNNMFFDVIIGNPPYQLNDGGNAASAMPIYQLFVEQAKKLNPRYLTMIIPARWYAGGRGLDDFRNTMLNDRHITEIVDFADSRDCFSNVNIVGGICYFLWNRDKTGDCKVVNITSHEQNSIVRKLNQYPVFVRSNKSINIIEKVTHEKFKSLSSEVCSSNPFGFRTYVTGKKTPFEGSVKLMTSDGFGFVPRADINKNIDAIDQYNVIISRAMSGGNKPGSDGKYLIIPSTMKVIAPGEICAETYQCVGHFDKEIFAINLKTYLSTLFVRFLMFQAMSGIMVNRDSFIFVPMQDFSHPWTDSMLYEKYGLTEDEIAFIESMIRPME